MLNAIEIKFSFLKTRIVKPAPTSNLIMKKRSLCLLALLCIQAHAADPIPVNPALNEKILMVPAVQKELLFNPINMLETSLFFPPGDGPFPVVVMNHGKNQGPSNEQARSRPVYIALEFLRRGYVVVAPNRSGFAGSEGMKRYPCTNTTQNGLGNAQDVIGVLDWIVQQTWADKNNMLVMGQSHGGLTTMALGSIGYPGVKGLVNFAGVLRNESCDWQSGVTSAMGTYGKTSSLPSLWFYGANDSYTDPQLASQFFDAYTASGGKAKLIAFGNFEKDAHKMSGSAGGVKIWLPEVESFLAAVGLPNKVVNQIPASAAHNGMPTPPASDFAKLDDVAAVPYLKDSGREGYSKFLSVSTPRAFAIGKHGSWSSRSGGTDPLKAALDKCQSRNKNEPCQLYAVDEDVVWKNQDTLAVEP